MKHIPYSLLLLVLYPYALYSTYSLQHYTKKIKSFFCRQTVKKIDYKEFPAASLHSISIENNYGPITIKTGWKKKSLCLTTIKHSKNQSELNNIKIAADTTKPHHLSLMTKHTQGVTGSVEYELIVPTTLNVSLITKYGDITVNDTEGNINAFTNQGNITIINTKNNIRAESCETGSIFIDNAQGAIDCFTNCGTITIQNIGNTLKARTKKGKIVAFYNDISQAQAIELQTSSGDISLTLPTVCNATIHGTTAHGTILSEQYITLKPYTTQLNNFAWKKLKREINGTIGLGDVDIVLSSLWGSIKILEKKP